MNTLDKPKPNSRESFLQNHVSRDRYASVRSRKLLSTQPNDLHYSNQQPAKKAKSGQFDTLKPLNSSSPAAYSGDATDDGRSSSMYFSKASEMTGQDATVAPTAGSTRRAQQPGKRHALTRNGIPIDNRGVAVEGRNESISLTGSGEDDSRDLRQHFNGANEQKMKTRGHSTVSVNGGGRSSMDEVLSVLSDGSSRDRARSKNLEEIFDDGSESRREAEQDSPDPLQVSEPTQSIFKSRTRTTAAKPSNKRHGAKSQSLTRDVKPDEVRGTKTWIGDHRSHGLIRIPLTEIQHGKLLVTDDSYEFVIDPRCKTFFIDFILKVLEDGQDPAVRPIDISKINRIHHGDDECCKVLLVTSQVLSFDNQFLLHLKSPHAVWALITQLQKCDESLQVGPKKNAFLDNYRKNRDRVLETMQGPDPSKKEEPTRSPHFNDSYTGRQAGSNQLQPKGSTGHERRLRGSLGMVDNRRHSDQPILQQATKHSPTSIDPVTVRQQTAGYVQEQFTRSTKRATRSNKSYVEDPLPQPRFSESQGFPPPWKRDLVYPEKSKKRETIKYEDLLRLDDDEFLNDTLVAFFIRYLEFHVEGTNPDLLKKMHFFNSYFYERLSQTEKGKRHEINFDAVKKWTRNYDIFSRDFVVVPVNENLHWYLAIICNLTYFKRLNTNVDIEASTSEVVMSNEHDGKPLHESDHPQDLASISERGGANSPSRLPDQAEIRLLSDNDGREILNSSQLSAATRRKGKRKSRPSLPKYDTKLPVIITLDSLGSSRSPTISTLRNYVVKEAQDKQNWVNRRCRYQRRDCEGTP